MPRKDAKSNIFPDQNMLYIGTKFSATCEQLTNSLSAGNLDFSGEEYRSGISTCSRGFCSADGSAHVTTAGLKID
jgi:hypothetical protein